eukprot:4380966-Prymnesium_polylepis.1
MLALHAAAKALTNRNNVASTAKPSSRHSPAAIELKPPPRCQRAALLQLADRLVAERCERRGRRRGERRDALGRNGRAEAHRRHCGARRA